MKTVRLDKFISSSSVISRKSAVECIKKGRVFVDGVVRKSPDFKFDPETSEVVLDGNTLCSEVFLYVMLNKPQGLVTSTNDKRDKTVMSLLPEIYFSKSVFPAGRLDKDTVGLLILTNDGELAHRLISPKHHAEKLYYVECDKDFEENDIAIMKNGILMDGKLTKEAVLEIDKDNKKHAHITLTEGKYHEIKRLCEHCGKEVLFLERLSFGGVELDSSLKRGEWRHLTSNEINILKSNSIGGSL